MGVSLTQLSPGAFTYDLVPPASLRGTIEVIVVAGSLADDSGRIFPSVDTVIVTI